MYYLTVLKAMCSSLSESLPLPLHLSNSHQTESLLRGVGRVDSFRESWRKVLPASALVSAGLAAIVSVSWLIKASSQSLPSSSHGVLSVCISVFKCPLL